MKIKITKNKVKVTYENTSITVVLQKNHVHTDDIVGRTINNAIKTVDNLVKKAKSRSILIDCINCGKLFYTREGKQECEYCRPPKEFENQTDKDK